MNRTSLYEWHRSHGARMVPFASWEMPVQYQSGALKEHELVRTSAGLFDIDHMGQFIVSGPGSGIWLDSVVSARVSTMDAGQARYALLLNEKGGVIDDLFIYRMPDVDSNGNPPESWFIVVNAANRSVDFEWMKSLLPRSGGDHFNAPRVTRAFSVTGASLSGGGLDIAVRLRDVSDDYAMAALQGPRALEVLDRCGWLEEGPLSETGHHDQKAISSLPRAQLARAFICGRPCLVGRTGYTGEDGVEIFYPNECYGRLWEGVLKAASEAEPIECGPIGLAARDSLRFEAGMPLHGHEISADINPVQAGLMWACDLTKDFIGKSAIEEIKNSGGPDTRLVTITVEGGVPREGYAVMDADGREVGRTVAGMFCPSVKAYACNAYVPSILARPGTELSVVIHGNPRTGHVVKRPLYIPVYRRSVVHD